MNTYTVYLTNDARINIIADGFEKSEDTIYFYEEIDSERKVVALFNYSNIYGFVLNKIKLSGVNTELIPS